MLIRTGEDIAHEEDLIDCLYLIRAGQARAPLPPPVLIGHAASLTPYLAGPARFVPRPPLHAYLFRAEYAYGDDLEARAPPALTPGAACMVPTEFGCISKCLLEIHPNSGPPPRIFQHSVLRPAA